MDSHGVPDPIEAMEQFLARITPFDPHPDESVMSMEIRIGRSRGRFEMTERAASALCAALGRYVDPDDCGRCDECGSTLDQHLRCRGCGHVAGVFGAVLADHMAEAARSAER